MGESDYLQRPDAKGHLKVLETLREWDPNGVICDDNLDEYDSYAPTIVYMLDAKAEPETLARYLRWLRTDQMGMRDSKSERIKELKLARQLVAWWNEWKST